MTDLSQLSDEELQRMIDSAPVSTPSSVQDMSDEQLMQAISTMDQPEAVSEPTPAPMPWSSVPGQMIDNFGSSAGQFVEDTVRPIMEPVETAKSLASLGMGVIQKLIPGEQADEATADAVGRFFVERYGGVEEIKRTLATDPVGALADLATVLTGGGAAAARAPGMAGKVASVSQKAGAAIDPLSLVAKGGVLGAKALGKTTAGVAGIMSGAGMTPVEEAYKAGRAGGDASQSFTSNMRGGNVEMDAILEDAKSGLQKMREDRNKAYRSGMVDISGDKTVIDFDDIVKGYQRAVTENTFNGVPKSEGAAKALKEIEAELGEWARKDPAVFHTPEGLDVLKQRIGDLADWKNKGDKENRAFNSMYNTIKGVIEKQAPAYSEIMRDYYEASAQIKEIEKALSLKDTASADTALRKLTSVMRNNVNTNYGKRADQVEALQTASGKPLLPAIAGQSMNAWTPRGLQSLGTHAAVTGTAGAALTPWALATLPAQSPRLVGEAAHAIGKVAGGAQSAMARVLGNMSPEVPRIVGQDLFQAGRISEEEQTRQQMMRALMAQ